MCLSSCCPSLTFRHISAEPNFSRCCRASTARRTSLFCARCSRTPPKKASRACRSATSATCRSRVDLIAALHGDWPLNVYNSAALAFWKEQGLSSACVSFELRDAQIRDLSKCLPCEAIVYGRLPLMLTENCLNANAFGCRYFTERPASVPCDGACASAPELTDRRGEHFPVLRAWGCRSEIENGKILYLADKSKDWQTLGLRFAQLRFTTESASECVRVLRAYQGETVEAPENITRGLFYRGAE
ncbi:MAG: U32 family peptidase [Oscillospiraceae bacterium]